MEGISEKYRQLLSGIERPDSITFNPQKCMDVAKLFRPSTNKPQWNKIQELINKGIEEDVKVIAGGSGKPEGLDGGYYVKSTLFVVM